MTFSSFIFECCGGERFVSIAGLGSFHVPPYRYVTFSIALPSAIASYVLMLVAFSALLLWLRIKRAISIAVVFTLVSTPLIFRSPLALFLVDALSEGQSLELEIQEQSSHLRDTRDAGVMQKIIHNVSVVNAETANRVADRVMGLTDRWYYPLSSRGTPHFQLGVRYGGILKAGRVWNPRAPKNDSALLWRTFQDFYEAVRSALSKELGVPVRLHPHLWPPTFLIWLSSFTFGFPSDVHDDELLPEDLRRRLMSDLEQRSSDVSCDWHLQQTLIAAIKRPRDVGEAFGAHVWTYNTNVTSCPRDGPARSECVGNHNVLYEEGAFTMFPSKLVHYSKPWRDPHISSLDLNPRIIMVAFVIPCRLNGEVEYEITGSIGR